MIENVHRFGFRTTHWTEKSKNVFKHVTRNLEYAFSETIPANDEAYTIGFELEHNNTHCFWKTPGKS